MRCSVARNIIPVLLLGGCMSEPAGIEPTAAEIAGPAEIRTDARRYSDWSNPMNLGPVVNSEFFDYTPDLSSDGRSLYFASLRPGGQGSADIWVARRSSMGALWEAPVNLGPPINTLAVEAAPSLSRDGHWLYFGSHRPGGQGAFDIWVSWRADINDDLAWRQPVNLGPQVNSSVFDAIQVGHGREFYIASPRPSGSGAGDTEIFITRGRGSRLAPPVHLPQLGSPGIDQAPRVSRNGRELFLTSNREGSTEGSPDIWTAKRRGVPQPWSVPTLLDPGINTPHIDQQPVLSKDGTTMFFVSNRPGGLGGLDIYVTHRARLR